MRASLLLAGAVGAGVAGFAAGAAAVVEWLRPRLEGASPPSGLRGASRDERRRRRPAPVDASGAAALAWCDACASFTARVVRVALEDEAGLACARCGRTWTTRSTNA